MVAFWINVVAVLVNVGVLLIAPKVDIPGMYWFTVGCIVANAFVAGVCMPRWFA